MKLKHPTFMTKLWIAFLIYTLCLLYFTWSSAEAASRIKHPVEYEGRSKNPFCDCGYTSDSYEQGWHPHPWIVGLYRQGKVVCGGSLIETQYILTAAHCLGSIDEIEVLAPGTQDEKKDPMNEMFVVLSMHYSYGYKVLVKIDRHFIHPAFFYKESTPYNDIAILRLERPVFYTSRLKPICLPVDPNMARPGKLVTTIGWGSVVAGYENNSDSLREVDQTIVDIEECNKLLKSDVMDSALCAVGEGDTCQGDSGGPVLTIDDHERFYQVGVVSWGRDCGIKGMPAVYTRTTSFLHWIRNITGDSLSCETLLPPLLAENTPDCGIAEEPCDVNNLWTCLVDEYMFSWMAKIYYQEKYIGTGILINASQVLTTTAVLSPWKKYEKEYFRVLLGMSRQDLDLLDFVQVESEIAYYYFHFMPSQVPLVVIQLAESLEDMTLLHRPICLPNMLLRNVSEDAFSIMFWTEINSTDVEGKNSTGRSNSANTNDANPESSEDQMYHSSAELERSDEKARRRRILKTSRVTVKRVELRDLEYCKVPKRFGQRVVCVEMTSAEKSCHESGAVLLKFRAGRFYLMGVVLPGTKRCSRRKTFLDITWHADWIQKVVDANLLNSDAE